MEATRGSTGVGYRRTRELQSAYLPGVSFGRGSRGIERKQGNRGNMLCLQSRRTPSSIANNSYHVSMRGK